MNAPAIRERHNSAPPVSLFRAPDMAILSGGRTKPPPLPAEMFGDIWPLVRDLADGAGAPADYVALSMLSVGASLIGGKRRVRPYDTSDWSEPAILWIGAVGDPSSNKSPAIDAATSPLRGMEGDHADGHRVALMLFEASAQRAKAERKNWEADVAAASKDRGETPPLPDAAVIPDEPERRRLLVQDGTPEAVAQILSGNPAGTLHLRDELAGWLSSFDRYSPGGREFWLEAHGGRPFVVDRKGAKAALRVPFTGVSVLGGIQPEKLVDCLLSGADDGLVARFLWAWPDAIPYQRPRRVADVHRLERIYRRLDGLRFGMGAKGDDVPITLPLEGSAGDLFEVWVREHQATLSDTASLFKGFCGKLQGTVLRLSLVSELLRWADGNDRVEPDEIKAETVIAAIEFAETYAKPTAMRVFGDAALPPVERNAAALARYILKSQPRGLNARDMRRTCAIPALKDAERMADAIEALVDADWLRPAPARAGDTPGRARSDYDVNPAIYGENDA
jgi:hypothetical protein